MQPNKSLSPRNHLKDRITAAQSELTHKLAVIEPPSNLTPPRTIRHLLVLSLSPWCPNCQITFPLFSRLSIKIHFSGSSANVHDRIERRRLWPPIKFDQLHHGDHNRLRWKPSEVLPPGGTTSSRRFKGITIKGLCGVTSPNCCCPKKRHDDTVIRSLIHNSWSDVTECTHFANLLQLANGDLFPLTACPRPCTLG